MYTTLLTIHNLLRWVVLIAGLVTVIRAISGLSKSRSETANPPERGLDRAGLIYTVSFDLQVLVGLILFFAVSPITTRALSDFAAAMGNTLMRYFTVEHSLMMLVALALAHVGRALSRRAVDDRAKFRRAAIWYTLSLVLMLVAIPWPFLEPGRPLFRLFGLDF